MKTRLTLATTFCVAAAMAMPALAQTNGADVYKAKCQMCHGTDGTSNTPAGKAMKATSFKSPAVMKASDSDLIAVVKNGKGKMPAYASKLSDAQINAAIAYVRKLQHS